MRAFGKCTVLVAGLGLLAGGLQAVSASANPAGTNVVISEVYGGGGNTGAPYRNDFIELYNPTPSPISVAGWSVQYRTSTGTSAQVTPLAGSVAAGAHYLIQEAAGANTSAPLLPTPDATGAIPMSGTSGVVLLVPTTAPFTTVGNLAGNPGLVDAVGYGSAATSSEAAPTATLSNTTSATRNAAGADTDNNSSDFSTGAPGPQNSSDGGPPPPPPPADKTIAEIQGTGASSPLVGQTVHTTGIVTAAYPSGGFNGIYIQTAGTGGGTDATPGASDAVYVFGSNSGASSVALGDFVDVTGVVSEFNGLTEITPAAGGVIAAAGTAPPVTPLVTAYPTTDTDREAHEGELLAPTDQFTVTNTYSTNQYAEIGLATGTTPLIVPTEVADAQDGAAIAAVNADNAARAVTLDDGASINFLSPANQSIPLPWLSPANPIRVAAQATLHAPVLLDYRNNTWKFQPQQPVTDQGGSVATFANTRTESPEAVPGNLHLATFNVLNYFNTTGVDYEAAGHTCTYYNDRAGNHNTVNDCGPTGPRGAAEADDLNRQQTKIVAAINALGVDIVSLEEVENSVALGEPNRDDALSTLVDALNTAAGSTRWAFAPSPSAADLPPTSEQDVIRTAFIYNPSTVSLVGASKVLVGSAAFSNAREPLAQAFKAKDAADSAAFAVVVNHFKSKGSGVDDGTGQGNANPDRVAQAQDLIPFANDFAASRGTDKILLTGDFNSYSQEDPMQVLYGAGYQAINSSTPNEWTYSFGGQSGSLDHVLANPAALGIVAGADIWSINSGESVAFEYSRDNYNVTNFYQPNMFRASDHDPEVVGLTVDTAKAPVTLNLLGVNDFHGRINANTVKWAGTVEQLTEQGGADNTLLVGAGDLMGASEFASAVANDQPTIDMFNALGLDASAVGNHEFDQGWPDLRDRIIGPSGHRNAQWDYLGANVYAKGTTTPVLPEYAMFTVHGVQVGVIGAVTEETSSLVSPGGIQDIEFGNAVDAVNRVAHELSDGDPSNGEADVIVASFHAGATQGVGSNYAAEIAKGGEFAQMANLDPSVDAIFNGHTHQAYAWDAPIPGDPSRTRPIIQTGQYGDNVGQVQLTIDPNTDTITGYTVRNVARTTVPDSTLVSTYPRVAQVKTIVDAALANAAQVGNTPVGSITADITTAFVGASRDDRASESTLGDLVANALRDGLPADAGTADIGIVNPGGLRAELRYAGDTSSNPANTDGVVTYAEANSVLPFVNNIWTVQLTGAQLKDVLEQQWQPTGSSRPFLALGLSDNVRVTQDPTRPRGSRITSVIVNGTALDPARSYTISTFSFLGTGGDNFGAFTQGTHRDTGLVDRDVWIGYLQHHAGLSPDFARQQVVESGLPATVSAGDSVSFTLSNLDLTSLGSPANTAVTVYLRTPTESRKMGSYPVSNGSASVGFTAPADLGGPATITAVAVPSGTLIGLPLTPSRSQVSASAAAMTYGTDGAVAVTVTANDTPTGSVSVLDGSTVLGSAVLSGGSATVPIPGTALEPGSHTLTVRYAGNAQTNPSATSVVVQVAKATSTTSATATPSVVHRKGSSTIAVAVTAPGTPASGTVVIYVDGDRDGSVTLGSDGTASYLIDKFQKVGEYTVEARYLGSSRVLGSSVSITVTVIKK